MALICRFPDQILVYFAFAYDLENDVIDSYWGDFRFRHAIDSYR